MIANSEYKTHEGGYFLKISSNHISLLKGNQTAIRLYKLLIYIV